MISRDLFRVLFVLCAACLTASRVHAQDGASRQLTLVRPSDSSFDATIEEKFAGLTEMQGFAAYRPYLVVLSNETGHSALGYSVLWDIASSDGMTHQLQNRYIQRPFGPIPLRHPLIAHEIRLISPSFNLTPGEFSVQKQGIARILSTLSTHPPYSSTNITSVVVSVDAAIYDDGAYTGNDRTQFIMQYQCVRDAEAFESSRALSLLNRGAAADEVAAALQEDIRVGQVANTAGRGRDSVCAFHRGEEAQDLLLVQRRDGLQALGTRAATLSSRPNTPLHRIP